MAFKMKPFSGFMKSKADVINAYAAGVSKAFEGIGDNFELKKEEEEKEEKEDGKKDEKKSTKEKD